MKNEKLNIKLVDSNNIIVANCGYATRIDLSKEIEAHTKHSRHITYLYISGFAIFVFLLLYTSYAFERDSKDCIASGGSPVFTTSNIGAKYYKGCDHE